jgi:hypothetical protein
MSMCGGTSIRNPWNVFTSAAGTRDADLRTYRNAMAAAHLRALLGGYAMSMSSTRTPSSMRATLGGAPRQAFEHGATLARRCSSPKAHFRSFW